MGRGEYTYSLITKCRTKNRKLHKIRQAALKSLTSRVKHTLNVKKLTHQTGPIHEILEIKNMGITKQRIQQN